MTDAARTIAVSRRLAGPDSRGAMAVLLGLALIVQAAAAAPARDSQQKILPPTRVAPRFDLGEDVRDPFLPSAVLQGLNASPGGSGTAAAGTPPAGAVMPPIPVRTGPVTLDEVVAAVMVQGVYRIGTQSMATVSGNPVQAGAIMPLMVRGQACPVTVVAVDTLAQKVLLKYKGRAFERKLNPGQPAGGGPLK